MSQYNKLYTLTKVLLLSPLTQDFVSSQIGQRFIEPQTADLSIAYKDSSPTSPLIFVLSVVSTREVYEL